MTKIKRIFLRAGLVFIILIPVAAFAHYLIFPQETRVILIDFSNFKKEGKLYFNAETPQGKIDSINQLLRIASERVAAFWGEKKANPKFIYCNRQEDFKRYSISATVPAVTYCKMGSYIVLSNDGVDIDIIAHETSHAELYKRIGFFNKLTQLPLWFDEGLAMQNDYRNYYSEDTLKARSDNFTQMPNVKLFTSAAQFYAGTREQVMLNYMAAKHEVKNWYTKDKLEKLVADLNAGRSFNEAYENH